MDPTGAGKQTAGAGSFARTSLIGARDTADSRAGNSIERGARNGEWLEIPTAAGSGSCTVVNRSSPSRAFTRMVRKGSAEESVRALDAR